MNANQREALRVQQWREAVAAIWAKLLADLEGPS